MSQGLTSMVGNASSVSSAVKKGIEINILDELGITGRQTAFNMRTLALSKPEVYAQEREKRFVNWPIPFAIPTTRFALSYRKAACLSMRFYD